ncbi:unnamed protein product [Rotaria sp. Silwood1]|nr:unnamed protein product [Rotaria sp. Silwood1]CAF1058798.1 unnamed protein product [Rotaria sp. Silwood1]CAF3416734.1 unnamed protein product [Rotaria sp. Silwood1]
MFCFVLFCFVLFLPVKDFLLTRLFSIGGIDFNRDSNIEARPMIVPDQRTIISDFVFDYEEKLVYFYCQTSQMIYSSKMDGEKNLTNPRSIAVDLRAGVRFLFLTYWDKNSRIARCSIDGQQRLSIVNDTIQMPLGLTFDLICEVVYFTNHHLNCIEVYDSNSNEIRRLNRFEHGIKAQKHKKILSRLNILHVKISNKVYQPLGLQNQDVYYELDSLSKSTDQA